MTKQAATIEAFDHRATYSPEDNKLRIYPAYRFSKEDYSKLKSAGFSWAPKQELFVAPMWTPEREDIAVYFCGEISDEDSSLVDRAEIRSERFEEYSEKRLSDAEAAKKYVSSIADGIPLGQPILIGHHSERRARKDAQRIENGMRKAVKMWETSEYWERRAKGALRHAKYKELPDVRARRIKGIEADKRKAERNLKESKESINLWLYPVIFSPNRARAIANVTRDYDAYNALKYQKKDHKTVRNETVKRHMAYMESQNRWIAHYENRLIYEKAMLDEQGASDLIAKKPRPKQLPLLNYRAPGGIAVKKLYGRGETEVMPQVEMTKAEYAEINKDYKGTAEVPGSHRVRMACRINNDYQRFVVFLTDSAEHEIPEPVKTEPIYPDFPRRTYQPIQVKPKTDFDAIKETLRAGIKTVSAPQLFPTPNEIGKKMIDAAGGIMAGRNILEPSAGTGNLVRLIAGNATGFDCCKITAVEINHELCRQLEDLRGKSLYANESNFKIVNNDFLSCNGNLGKFDCIIMNPPFDNGIDIKHIKHAMNFLKPGGKLVALCANGHRQRDALMHLASHWEDLPDGSFKSEGTNVNVAMLVIES